MAATVVNIYWSPLQVASELLKSYRICHLIIGEVALMHYGASPAFGPEFSIEISVSEAKMSKGIDVLKSSQLFRDIPDHVITQSCYEGTIAHSRLQTVWNRSQPRNIILLPGNTFFDIMSFNNFPKPKYKGTQLVGLSEQDAARIPWADPHRLFKATIHRRVYRHDQLAALAAKRLFDTGKVSEQWLAGQQFAWNRRQYDLAMALVGKTITTGEPIQVAPNDENNHDPATVDGGGNGRVSEEEYSHHEDA